MTINFGCCERRTMASQPSLHNEERNLLRLRAWEQRNQEISQAKELNPENVPLFGEPYKTNKGDELSNRIQRMLGSYEDVNDPHPLAIEMLPVPAYVTFSESDRRQPSTDNTNEPPFNNQVLYMPTQSQKARSTNGCSSQATRTSTASTSSCHHGLLSAFSHMNHSQLSLSAPLQNNRKPHSDIREGANLPEDIFSQSPVAIPVPFQWSSDQDNTITGNKNNFDGNELQESRDYPDKCSNNVDVTTINIKQSPRDGSVLQTSKGTTLPAQTFPSLLSKQPSVLMMQKPTAYVRPMDGQDQMLSESPELKSSPEPYVPLPKLINKSEPGKTKTLPQYLETQTNEVQCVKEILKEMTHTWPPLLTVIHTPSEGEPAKLPFPAQAAKNVSSCPGKKNSDSPSIHPSKLIQQSTLLSFKGAHSRRVDSASSSDSDSSSRSGSDSESTTEEPYQHQIVKTEPDVPAVHVDWQLGNWIRSSQQNLSSESQSGIHTAETPSHKQPPLPQSSKASSAEVDDPTSKFKPQLSSYQGEFTGSLRNLAQQCSDTPQDSFNQQSNQISPSANWISCSRKLSSSTFSSKPVKTGCSEATISMKCEEVLATRNSCFQDRPKVKTKTGRSKKSKKGSDTKRDRKRTSKQASHEKQKAGSESEVVLYGHCPTCGVQNTNSCSCPTQSPAQLDQLASAPPVKIDCSKPKYETICQKAKKGSYKKKHKHSGKTDHTAKSSRDLHKPSISLMVKIDLSLLTRVPQATCNEKRSVRVIEQDGGSNDASTIHHLSKTSTKCIPQNVEIECKTIPTKKPKLENKKFKLDQIKQTHLIASRSASKSPEERERKEAWKHPVSHTAKELKLHKHKETAERRIEASKDSRKHKRSSGKHTEERHFEKQKTLKSSFDVPSSSQPTNVPLTNRPLLKFEERSYPVKHFIKEAKKLKHKADAESDKLTKAFSYMDAAMFFVESGIAMEKDPQISMSSYTMFAETVELLKFVLKLKNSVDPPAPTSEKDFFALCLKCQSLLHMAIFRHKYKTALKYSKTLTDHFKNSSQKLYSPSVLASKVTDTPSPKPDMPSPANTSSSSGPGSNHSASGFILDPNCSTVAVPRAIEQVAYTYVNITTLFLSAHDIWERAEELAHKGSGMLRELDTVMGPLSMTSSMSSMVRYTRQGVHWLRLDSHKEK